MYICITQSSGKEFEKKSYIFLLLKMILLYFSYENENSTITVFMFILLKIKYFYFCILNNLCMKNLNSKYFLGFEKAFLKTSSFNCRLDYF